MDKSPDAFRTISEVAELLDTPAHVLRFWESRFPQIKPVKRAGGRRYYRPVDVDLLIGIRKLLHDDGLTIRGVQKVLREQGVRHVSGLAEEVFDDDPLDIVPVPAPRSVDPIPLFPVKQHGAAVAETFDEAEEPKAVPQPDVPQLDAPQSDDAIIPTAALAPDAKAAPAVTEDVTDAEQRTAILADPTGDTSEEDLPEEPTIPQDETAPEQPLAPPTAQHADDLSPSDSAPDDEDVEPGNIFVEADLVNAVETPGAADANTPPDEAIADTEESVAAPADNDAVAEDAADSEAPTGEPLNDVPPTASTAMAEDVIADAAQEPATEGPPMPTTPYAPKATEPVAAPPKQPLPVLDTSEIHAEWLPADLRSLRSGSFGERRPEAEVLLQRLQALRNRVGDLGRVPRR